MDEINTALDTWLDNIIILEERCQIVSNLQERVNRTLLQIQQEGLTSMFDLASLQHIGQIWINLVQQFQVQEEDKRPIINNVLQLYALNQISMELCTEIILKL